MALDRCPNCPHLIAHHGPEGCEHTPGYDAGEPRDCECGHGPGEPQET